MKIKPFRGLRPIKEKVKAVACRPYDVLNSDEAREEARGNPRSFLRVTKPEITLSPDIDPYSESVYAAGRDNFQDLLEQGIFFQDERDCFYIYELTLGDRVQTGVVACAAVEDYLQGRIRKHELTRPDKENDRKRHVRATMMNAEPVFLAYRAEQGLDDLIAAVKQDEPEYDFASDDGVRHRFWIIGDNKLIAAITAAFAEMPATYVADGHHRTAAAALVGNDLKNENPGHTGDEEYNYFLAVHFPHDQLHILDYNRVVKDLNGHDKESFLKRISGAFEIASAGRQPCKPVRSHEIGMYLGGEWYALRAGKNAYDDGDPIAALDVTILSERILNPVLAVRDLRTDQRIDFVGGIRGLGELQSRVDSGEMAVAFALYPVSMEQLMAIADKGLIMPPKVTWFEPKLRSGLVVHRLNNGV